MTRINTNVSSLVAQNRLQSSNKDLQTALTRLSTGLRINSGSDDPAGLIASEALRSEITSLNKSISNTRRASQIISTADSALGQVSNLLNDIRGLVVEAANSGALSQDEIAANQLQVDSSLEAINRIAQTTTFQGRKLLDGSLAFITAGGTGSTNIRNLQIDQASLGPAGSVDISLNVTVAATQAAVDITGFVPSAAVAATAEITFGSGGNTTALTISNDTAGTAGNGATVTFAKADLSGAGGTPTAVDDGSGNITVTINDQADTTIAAIVAAIDGLGSYSVTTVDEGTGAADFAAADPAPAGLTFANGVDAGTENIAQADVVFELAGKSGSEVFNISQGTTLDQLVAQVNLVSDATGITATANGTTLELRSSAYGSEAQVDLRVLSQGTGGNFGTGSRAVGTDIVATVNGRAANGVGNRLAVNTATINMNADMLAGFAGTAEFTISGGGAKFQLGPEVVSNQQARLGIGSVNSARLGGVEGRLFELSSGESAALATDPARAARIVNEAINQVTGIRGRLGAFQATSLESNLVSLSDTVANLQDAESTIRDADFAAESAALTRAQILVQSGTNVLALANQNPQNVLSLLR